MQLIRVRQTPIAEPEFFVETFGIDNKGFAFPFTDRTAVIEWVVRIASKLALLRTSIGVDDSIIPVPASDEYEDALSVAVFIELHTIRQLVLPWAAGRHAEQKHWIILQN